MHPTERAYTFHSHVHNVYTRIDFFFVDLLDLLDLSYLQYPKF